MSKTDQKDLRKDECPLERNHLRYLLGTDSEIQYLFQNKNNLDVFIQPFLFDFGLVNNPFDEIDRIDKDIIAFK